MTYALAWPLQQAVFALLDGDAGVAAHLAGRIYDAPPPLTGEAAPEGLYAVIGDEEVADWSTKSDHGASHLITIAVNAPRAGFAEAKQAAGAISDALIDAQPTLARGHLVSLRFVDARTRREAEGEMRRIEMRFRAVLEDTV